MTVVRTRRPEYMSHVFETAPRAPWYRHAGKLLTAAASTGAALVSIASFLYSYGVVGNAESHRTVGSLGVAWVGLRPASDTATSLGDTLHLAATITDRNGAVLVGAKPSWSSENPAVATVLPDGSVIARGPGLSVITVAVGNVVARSRVFVRPRVATVEVAGAGGDSALVVGEGDRLALRAVARDARGNVVRGPDAEWHSDDTTVARVDSAGTIVGELTGRTVVSAIVAGVAGHASVQVASTPAAIAVIAGSAQRGAAGSTLPQPVVLRVTSRRDRPVEGVTLMLRLSAGQGSVTPAAPTTDADGRARVTWTLGDVPGRQALLAAVARVDSAVAVEAEADPVAANTRVRAGDLVASVPAAGALAEPAVVYVTDSSGRALADVPVTWVALDGGSAVPVAPRTDSLGAARATWTLGPRAGAQRLRAHVGAARASHGVPPVTLTAHALAGAPATLMSLSGDAQRGTVGAALPRAIVLRVLDAAGNGVANAPLVLSPSAGTLADTSLRTDSTGTARVRWTLGRVAGAHTLGVRLAGLPRPLRLTAIARPAPAANVEFDDGTAVGRAGARRLAARVTDAFGNVVADVPVRFSTRAGRLSPARAVTDAKGRASVTWTPPSATRGEQTLMVSVVGATGVTATFTRRR